MIEPWHDCSEHSQWPLAIRAYVGYCRYGLQRKNGGAFAGNALFRLTSLLQRCMPGRDSCVRIQFERPGISAFLDSLDLESLIHTLPALSRGSTGWRFISQVLQPGDTFVDVGANYGIYTLQAAKLVGPTGRVLAFEPNTRVRSALQKSLRQNGFDNVTLRPEALSFTPGSARLWNPRASGSASLSEPDDTRTSSIDVAVETLDRVLTQESIIGRIGLVKVDVEGWELNVFRGAENVLSTVSPPIMFEVNNQALQQSHVAATELELCLRSFGYDRFVTVSSAAWGQPQDFDFLSANGIDNVVATKSGNLLLMKNRQQPLSARHAATA